MDVVNLRSRRRDTSMGPSSHISNTTIRTLFFTFFFLTPFLNFGFFDPFFLPQFFSENARVRNYFVVAKTNTDFFFFSLIYFCYEHTSPYTLFRQY